MNKPQIVLKSVNLFYDKGASSEVHAIQDLSLEVETGTYAALFGPSGCGKSTVLSVIAGVEQPDSGTVTVDNAELHKLRPDELASFRQRSVGIIFQYFNLIPSLSILDNVALPMAFIGIPLAERKTRAMSILKRLDILGYADRHPDELSGGQQQRVGIARALANDPPIILADEPIGSLDSVSANKVVEFLKELNEKDNRTVIMVTHESWSLRDAKKIFYMKDGRIINTDKESIIAKTEDAHLKMIHPDRDTIFLRAIALASYMLRGYLGREQDRFAEILDLYLRKSINAQELKTRLDLPFAKGGLGLWKQSAVKMAKQIIEAEKESETIDQLYAKLKKKIIHPFGEEMIKTRNWLLQANNPNLNRTDLRLLDEALAKRFRGELDSAKLQQFLDEPKRKGGLGLRSRTAAKISEKLESLISR